MCATKRGTISHSAARVVPVCCMFLQLAKDPACCASQAVSESSGSALCQDTWLVHLQDTPEDSMPAAVNNMVDALLQAGLALLRDDRSLDQAYFTQLLLLFRVSSTVSHALTALCGDVTALRNRRIVSAITSQSLLCQDRGILAFAGKHGADTSACVPHTGSVLQYHCLRLCSIALVMAVCVLLAILRSTHCLLLCRTTAV